MKKIVFLNITAEDNFEFGFKLGQSLARPMEKRIAWYKRKCLKGKIPEVQRKLLNFVPLITEHYPKIMEEIVGLSIGSTIPLEDLLISICDEEAEFFAAYSSPSRCTTLAARLANGDAVLAHNEDWHSDFLDNGLALVKAKISNLRFISLLYIGSLPGSSCALNSFGVAFSGNSIESEKLSRGIPKAIQLRQLVNARNLKQAIAFESLTSSLASNMVMVSKQRGAALVTQERLGRKNVTYSRPDIIVHTNHPLDKRHQTKLNTKRESLERYQAIHEALSSQPRLTEKTIKSVLTIHQPRICDHKITIGSAYLNATRGFVDVAYATPCNHQYKRYKL